MVHDSNSNAAKTCFVHVKSGGQKVTFDPHLKKVGSIDPLDPVLPLSMLPEAEDRTIVCLFVWTRHRNVTARQTDRQTARSYHRRLHCEQYGNVHENSISI